jgi:hypothetical protein
MPCSVETLIMGDFGPSWSSAIGGGLGSRGDRDGDMVAMLKDPSDLRVRWKPRVLFVRV